MKKNMRVEYLFPNIDDERKYKWLENALFVNGIADCEISKFTLKEYISMMNYSNTTFTNMKNEDVTKDVIRRNYQDWLHSPADFIYRLSSTIAWNNDIIKKLAVCLSKNPLSLPQFLNSQASDIIGLFLGETILLPSVRLEKSFHYDTFWKSQERSVDRYRRTNFDAKYKLSLFLGVIDELLDLGINLNEYQFRNLDCANTYNKLDNVGLWNELLKQMTENLEGDYVRCDGLRISKESLLDYIDFSNFQEFLEKVVSLTEIEYYIDFIEEPLTLDPHKILPVANSIRNMNDFPKENLIDVKTLCSNMTQKLKKVASETEVLICRRKVDALTKMTSERTFENSVDYDAFLEEVEKLYRMIITFPLKEKEELKGKLDQLTGEEIREQFSSKKRQQQENLKLEARITSLEERMTKTEEKVDFMEKALLDYLKNGGQNPFHQKTNLSKEEQMGIVRSFVPKTTGEKMRKALLLSALKVGAIGIVIGTIFFHGNIDRNLSKVSNSEYEEEEIVDSEVTITPNPSIEPAKENSSSDVDIPEEEKDIMEEDLLPTLKSNEEIVFEIIRGKWGDGEERERLLRMLGYDYDLIRSLVNKVIDKDGNIYEEEYKKVLEKIKKK